MSFLDKLKQIGLVEDDPEESAEQTVAQNPNGASAVPGVTSPSAMSTPYQASDNVAAGVADPKYLTRLQEEIGMVCSDKYRTYLAKLEDMKKIPGITESSAVQAAMIGVGITAEEIKAVYDAQLAKLSEEEKSAISDMEGKQQRLADESNQRISQLQSGIEANNAKINDLNTQNEAAFKEMSDLQAQVANGETRCENKASAFRASVAQVRAQVEQERNKAAQNTRTGGAK